MVIILIRRYARRDREAEFVEAYKKDDPTGKDGFLYESLTTIDRNDDIPPALKGGLEIKPDCVNYINVAVWESWEKFQKEFNPAADWFDDSIEVYPRERVVLNKVGGHGNPS